MHSYIKQVPDHQSELKWMMSCTLLPAITPMQVVTYYRVRQAGNWQLRDDCPIDRSKEPKSSLLASAFDDCQIHRTIAGQLGNLCSKKRQSQYEADKVTHEAC